MLEEGLHVRKKKPTRLEEKKGLSSDMRNLSLGWCTYRLALKEL